MKKKKWLIISIIAVIMALVFSGIAGWQMISSRSSKAGYEQMREENETLNLEKNDEVMEHAGIAENIEETTAEDSKQEENSSVSKIAIPVDFDKLQKENPDIYAWIKIPGTVIDYPVVQSPDNDAFYLDHAVDKTYSFPGAIFSESYNGLDFKDYLTVLYGHNMRDGSMFAGLHKYSDSRYFHEHDQVIVYTPDSILHYTIFAAYRFDNRHLMYEYNSCRNVEDRKRFLKDIRELRNMNAYIDPEADVTENDHILTLSTCDSAGHAYRFLVQAYLTKTEN